MLWEKLLEKTWPTLNSMKGIYVKTSFKLIIDRENPENKVILFQALADPNISNSYKEQLTQ